MEIAIIIMLSAVILLLLICTACCGVVAYITYKNKSETSAKDEGITKLIEHLSQAMENLVKSNKAVREDIETLNENLGIVNSNQDEIYQRLQAIEVRFNYILPGTRSPE